MKGRLLLPVMEDIIINVEHVTKLYKLYKKPIDRLKESLSFDKSKKYCQDFYALDDISFKVKKGETLGIIGKNGAGKSTLLKIITEVLKPTSGTLAVKGMVSALLELGAGFNPEYTGMENIYLNGAMMGMKHSEIDAKINTIIEFADIGNFIYQPVKSYSSGMFARLAFAVAISSDPEILIVDESLSVGDTRFQIKCMNYMKKMMEDGTTVLFVSHDINAIRRFCNRAIWLHQGKMMCDGEVNRVADAYLDFLKLDEQILDWEEKEKRANSLNIADFTPKEGIAEIVGFEVCDRNGIVGEDIMFDEPITVSVIYDVFDTSIKSPVLGVAIRSADDDYTCGLNTLLDQVKIPWKYGRNKVSLHYPYGIRAAGGRYYFEAALEDQTATVAIHYLQRISAFNMTMKYVYEGRYNIPHTWEINYE